MAVYTHVDPDDLAALVSRYDIGTVRSCKGIAEGVENSNYLLETSGGRFILTLYEKRVQVGDLPFFVDLLDHLAGRDCPVPAMIHDREGIAIQQVAGRAACIIQFLSGISPSHPTPGQCEAVGAAFGAMHRAAAPEGRTVQIVFHGGPKATANFGKLMMKRLWHTGSTLRPRSNEDKAAMVGAIEATVLPWILKGQLKPLIDSEFSLRDAAKAHARMESGQHIGKIVLTV